MAKDNIIRYPKQSRINIAVLILIAVLVYLIAAVYTFFSKEQIVGYEVREGTLMGDNRFEAIILRDEHMVSSDRAGYVNYFVSERERVGVGNLVYAIDESGALLDYMETSDLSENTLDELNKKEFRSTLDSFVEGYTPQNMESLYQLNVDLQNQTQKLANNRLLDNVNSISSLNGMINYQYAAMAGNVVYWEDGYENLTAAEITSDMFTKQDYQMRYMQGNDLVAPGDYVYKILDNEKWSVAFTTTNEELTNRLLEEEVVKVRFLKNDISIWGNVSLVPNAQGESVVVLEFQSCSVNFSKDRFVEIEIELEDEKGLKIPVSSIAQKDFYLVPTEYVVFFESEDTYYINLETYMENGEKTIKRLAITPYSLKDDMYYLDDVNLSPGAVLVKNDSQDKYTISAKASLTGVYNMNKGYADFKQITVNRQNDTYAIVESNTQYGLNVYDYIVLNASAVAEDDFIYE